MLAQYFWAMNIMKAKYLLWLILFGSLWGTAEVFAGASLYEANIPRASVYLSTFALFLLATARGLYNKPGSSSAIGAIAAVYRVLNTAPFFCHIGGILFLGMAFDLAASFLMRKEQKISYRSSLAGILSAYGGNAFFAVFMTYAVRYEYWTSAGFKKVIDHMFVSGSFQAFFAVLLVPLGYWLGTNGVRFAQRHPRLAYGTAALFSLGLWILGQI